MVLLLGIFIETTTEIKMHVYYLFCKSHAIAVFAFKDYYLRITKPKADIFNFLLSRRCPQTLYSLVIKAWRHQDLKRQNLAAKLQLF